MTPEQAIGALVMLELVEQGVEDVEHEVYRDVARAETWLLLWRRTPDGRRMGVRVDMTGLTSASEMSDERLRAAVRRIVGDALDALERS